jgi:enoyl-CoA hydratase
VTRSLVRGLTSVFESADGPVVLTGNSRCFSAGADLNEIRELNGAQAHEFALLGQGLMNAVDHHPAPVVAAIEGYCMGGGLDLALACDVRIAARNAVFGHRGAALGIMTGWGGTQRLPRLIGKSLALQLFLTAEMLHAEVAREYGLVDRVSVDPLMLAIEWLANGTSND